MWVNISSKSVQPTGMSKIYLSEFEYCLFREMPNLRDSALRRYMKRAANPFRRRCFALPGTILPDSSPKAVSSEYSIKMLINILLSLLFTLSHAIPLHTPNRTAPTLTSTSVASFPKGTWLENLAIRQSDRSDGYALVTILSAPEVYLVSTSNEFAPIKVATFPNALGCLRIVELRLDIFYVVVGDWSASTGLSTPGSYSVWEIDMRERSRRRARLWIFLNRSF